MAGNKSRIEAELSEEDRLDFDRLLMAGRLTLKALVEWLDEKGYSIGKSVVGRYKNQYDEQRDRLRERRLAFQGMAQDLERTHQGKQGLLIGEMIQNLTHDVVCKLEKAGSEQVEIKDIMMLSKGFAELAKAGRYNQDFEVKLEEVRTKAKAEAEAEARARLEKMVPAQEGRKLSEMTTEELEKAIIKAIAHE